MKPAALISALSSFDGLAARLEEWITPRRTWEYLKALADTPSPSGTAFYSRGPVVESLLRDDGLAVRVHLNFGRTGSVLVEGGGDDLPVWVVAHLDQPSYLLEEREGQAYPLVPYCYHLATKGFRPGVALAYQPGQGLVKVTGGRVGNPGPVFYPEPEAPNLPPGTRVVMEHPLDWNRETDVLTGHLDNAVGVTAALLAAGALAPYQVSLQVLLPDEEEGPEGLGNQTFSRGARRAVPLLREPRLAIVLDTHVLASGCPEPGGGASFAEKASRTRGAVTPPHLMSFLDMLRQALAGQKIPLRQNRGYIPRSDCVSVIQRTGQVALLGMPVANRHFDAGPPTGRMEDLLALAKATAVCAALTHTSIWHAFEG